MRIWKPLVTKAATALVVVLTVCAEPAYPASTDIDKAEGLARTIPRQAATSTPQPSPIDLRTVDWAAWIASDPSIDHPHVPAKPDLGPFVAAKGDPGFFVAMGYALIHQILYAGFSERDQAAVVPIYSTENAQNHGMLIYAVGDREPVFVASLSGFNMRARMEGSDLLISQDLPGDVGIRGYRDTRYRLQDKHLITVADSNRGESAYRRVVVEEFYRHIRYWQFKEAYALTSPEFQSNYSYDEFAAGFQYTVSLSAKASDQADGLIRVDIASTERKRISYTPQQFTGTWSVIWSTTAQRWLLDRSKIVRVPLTGVRAMDWTRFLKNEANLFHPVEGPDYFYGLTGPFVASKPDNIWEGAYGYAMVDDVFYASLVPGAAEQAFVWLDSGTVTPECGTFHAGLLVYRTDGDKPVLAGAVGGQHLSAVVAGSQLIVKERLADNAQDGKCGSSGFRETRYTWESNHLVPMASYTQCVGGAACANSVWGYYYYLKRGDYARAYATLSPAYQATNPYDAWKAGFQNVISLDADVSQPLDGWVSASVTTTLRTSAGTISKHRTESWRPIWVGEWQLDEFRVTARP